MKKLQMLKQAMIAYVTNSLKAIWSAVAHPLTIVGKKNCDVADYRVYGNTVRDGTPTSDNPIEVKSVGDLSKNLLDKDTVGFLRTLGSKKRTETGIALKPATSSTITYTHLDLGLMSDYEGQTVKASMEISRISDEGYSNTQFVIYDSANNKRTPIGNLRTDGDKIFLEANIEEGYTDERLTVRLYVTNAVAGTYYNFNNLMVYTGEDDADYEPYKKYKVPIKVTCGAEEKTVNIFLDEPLMSMSYVGKKCVDYIDSVENVVIKYCYQEVYNGTESWEVRSASNPNTFSKRITQARNVVCSHYKTSSSNIVDNTIAANNSIRVYITDSRFATVDEFKAYLAQQAEAGTPVTAVFLSITAYNGSPTEKSINLPTIPQFKGTTVYEVQTEIPPSGIEVQYYG